MFNQDVFIEQLVKRQKSGKDYLFIGLYILAFLLLLLVIFIFIQYLIFFALLIVAGASWGLYTLITNRNLEFEYICTNGHVDIDTIYNKRKRKRKVSMSSKNMEILASVSDPAFRKYSEDKSYKTLDCTSNTGDANVWFFTGKYKDNMVLVLFEPESRIIEDCKRFNPRIVKFNPIQG